MHRTVAIDALESRRLLSGGVDATYGSASGVAFRGPGAHPTVVDATVDPAGRTIFVGTTYRAVRHHRYYAMFIARLNADGSPDGRFGVDGVSSGTPRGLTRLSRVLPLRGGGYLASDDAGHLARFNADGRIDSAFGRRGVVTPKVPPRRLFEQPDGKLLVVGTSINLDVTETDADRVNYAERLTATGAADTSFANHGHAWISNDGHTDEFAESSDVIDAMTQDSGGRLLASLTRHSVVYDQNDDGSQSFVATSAATEFHLEWLSAGGTPTALPPGAIYSRYWEGEGAFPRDRVGAAIERPDGAIAAMSRDKEEADQPPTLTLLKHVGAPSKTVRPINFASALPGFIARAVSERVMVTRPDNSLLIAGAMTSGTSRMPALVHVRQDFRVDRGFGGHGDGVLLLPDAPTGATAADGLRLNSDGSVTAFVSGTREWRGYRVFVDDRPVAAFGGASRTVEDVRIRVELRGVHAIDATTLGDDDLRLIDAAGHRTRARFLATTTVDGRTIASYRVRRTSLGHGTFSVRLIDAQVADVAANTVAGRTIGTIRV